MGKGAIDSGATVSIFVSNLPWKTTDNELASVFSSYGEVREIAVMRDKRGRSKGYGFVEMPESAGREAIRSLAGKPLNGRPMTVRPARPRR